MRYSIKALHKEAGIASWELRARIALTRLMFKYKYNEEYVDGNMAGSLTRSGPYYKVDRPWTDKFKESVSYLGRTEWNSLPSYLRCIDYYPQFKKDVKRLYNHHYFISIADDWLDLLFIMLYFFFSFFDFEISSAFKGQKLYFVTKQSLRLEGFFYVLKDRSDCINDKWHKLKASDWQD